MSIHTLKYKNYIKLKTNKKVIFLLIILFQFLISKIYFNIIFLMIYFNTQTLDSISLFSFDNFCFFESFLFSKLSICRNNKFI